MKFKELHSMLMSKGYYIVRESKHHIYSNGARSIPVPHCKEVAIGTLRDIFKAIYPNNPGLANKEMRNILGKAA